MKKLAIVAILVILTVVGAGACAPQTVVETVEVEVPVVETVEVEVPGEEVVVTQEVEVVVTEIVEVEKETPITIGYSAPGLDAFQAGVMHSFVNYGGDKGWTVITTNSDRDAEKQANQVENFISLGVDAIVAVPIDSQAFCSSAKRAMDAGIPVYTIDRAPIGCVINMTVQADNELGGTQSAEAIVGFLEEKYGEPTGVVLELQGDMGQNVAQLRSKGFNDVMAQYDGIEVISKPTEWAGENFNQQTLDVVGAQDVDAIYAHSDTVGTIPILSALEQLGKKIPAGEPGHIFLATIDGSPTCLENIRLGFQDQCSSQPNPDFGKLVDFIEIELEGGTIEEGPVVEEGAPWSPAMTFMSDTGMMLNLATTNVTVDNVDDPSLWGNP